VARHLALWLGRWPGGSELDVVACPARERPGWDGGLHPVVGVLAGSRGVLSVPPHSVEEVREFVRAQPYSWRTTLPAIVGFARRQLVEMVFRFTTSPADLPEAGIWIDPGHPGLPAWLRPFAPEVLVAFDGGGRYLSGVGVKRHDAFGHELAVGTDPAARGAGLAPRLVAQAARSALAGGAVATYVHDPDNVASARVADAAGLPDREWRILRLAD
jgi:hypothetical protein